MIGHCGEVQQTLQLDAGAVHVLDRVAAGEAIGIVGEALTPNANASREKPLCTCRSPKRAVCLDESILDFGIDSAILWAGALAFGSGSARAGKLVKARSRAQHVNSKRQSNVGIFKSDAVGNKIRLPLVQIDPNNTTPGIVL